MAYRDGSDTNCASLARLDSDNSNEPPLECMFLLYPYIRNRVLMKVNACPTNERMVMCSYTAIQYIRKGVITLAKTKTNNTVDVQPLKTRDEIEAFREALTVSSSNPYQKRNLLLFNIGINTGLRIGDIVKLRAEDVRGRSYVIVKEGKTEKMRTVPLEVIMPDIADYLDDIPSTEWLFPSRKGHGHISTTQAYRILTKAADFIGRTDIGTHSLRKTFGYHYYQNFNDIAELMDVFNHSSQAITRRYIGIDAERIADRVRTMRL